MFNFLGAIGQVGRMLPGYVDGYRNAIADNWKDLNQYSDVQAKQLQNLYTEATFNPLVTMQYNEAARASYLAQQDARANALGITLQPGRLRAAEIEGGFLPGLALRRNTMLMQYPQLAFGGMGMPYADTLDGAMGYPQVSKQAGSAARGSGANLPTLAKG